MTWSQCRQKPDYDTWIPIAPGIKSLGRCFYAKKREELVPKQIMEWECQKENLTKQNWDSIWSMSILQKFQYGGNASWCFRWTGTQSVGTFPEELARDRVSLNITENVSWWSCTKSFDCDTDPEEITILPVKIALKAGCACRGLKVNRQVVQVPAHGIDCKYSTVHSMGNLVWAASDGSWTTHSPVDGGVKEITLGIPTLCPIWKKSPFKGN